jgi:histidinol phosphatase-like enzyme
LATLALRSVPDAARYGRVIEEQGKVVAFLEKDPNRPGPGIINGGIYVLRREILDLVLNLPCSLEQDVYPALVERGEIRGLRFEGYFLDIGLPETLEQGHRELPNVRVRPAAFLDRKALVNAADGDSSRPEAFQWTRGAIEAIRGLNDRGYYVFVMSHRSGGAQATQAVSDAFRLNSAMQEQLAAEGAHVDRFSSEPDPSAGGAAANAIGAAKQKLVSNLFLEATNEWPIVGERSFFIGVTGDDIEAARTAGLAAHVFDGGDLARLVHSLLAQSV